MANNLENCKRYRPGFKFSFFLFVLIFGILLALFNINIGIGASLKIPFTNSNLSLGGSIGKKEAAIETLPKYLNSRIAKNNDFFNQSETLTIWRAEGIGIIVLGEQTDVPQADLALNIRR